MKELTLKLCAMAALVGGLAAGGRAADASAPVHEPSATTEPSNLRLPARLATTRADQQIQKWYDDLAAPDSETRRKARIELMDLPRRDLDALRRVVEKNGPPTAAQESALHEIVIQVYLAEQDYDATPTGFLGVHLVVQFPAGIAQPQPAGKDRQPEDVGVAIDQVIAGFCAFGRVQTGDLILGVESPRWNATPTASVLQTVISQLQPGRIVTLRLLRQGRTIEVPLRLSARPRSVVDLPTAEQFFNQRMQQAEQYWTAHFAALVDRAML